VAPDTARLFDASSLIELIRRGDGAGAAAFGQYTLALAFYEVGNSFWTDSAAQHLVNREDAAAAIDYLASVREEMEVVSLAEIGAPSVFETAWDEGVTYFDAAYLAAAQELSATLVTEDGGMANHAPDAVTVATVDDILAGT
jgi:predicted nucleic acid-binding protein